MLSTLAALKQEQAVESLRANIGTFKRWGGGILLLAGAWLILLGIWPVLAAGLFPG